MSGKQILVWIYNYFLTAALAEEFFSAEFMFIVSGGTDADAEHHKGYMSHSDNQISCMTFFLFLFRCDDFTVIKTKERLPCILLPCPRQHGPINHLGSLFFICIQLLSFVWALLSHQLYSVIHYSQNVVMPVAAADNKLLRGLQFIWPHHLLQKLLKIVSKLW